MKSSSSPLVRALLASMAFSAAACGVFGGDDAPSSSVEPGTDADGGMIDGPKLPPVGTPAAQSELTDELGVFVATNGSDSSPGTHAAPLASIQIGIDRAKVVGKRVYVCTGTYKESLVVVDTTSVIGGLDCTSFEWRVGTGTSRVEAPSSPAVTAKNITKGTRLEGLDIVAPNATLPSGSSIGLIADHAAALVVARSKITAGNAVKGVSGVDGVQLANAVGTTTGAAIPGAALCDASLCPGFSPPLGGAGGTNVCTGAPGHSGGTGGRGGTGGLWDVVSAMGTQFFAFHNGDSSFDRKNAAPGFTGAAGIDGPDGPAPAAMGTITADGYLPADGKNGTDGAPGSGGSGGDGQPPQTVIFTATPVGAEYRGWGGGGGGAGGCPGLSGTAGKGGGASIAALLLDSPMTFDNAQLTSQLGGEGGHGTIGSAPLPGGARNNPEIPGQYPALAPALGHVGGRGGAAGTSSNGSSGPSVAIAHSGAAPMLTGGSTTKHGTGGPAIDLVEKTFLGISKVVPATPAGVEKDILAF